MDPALRIGDIQYLRVSGLGALSALEKDRLRAQGALLEPNYLVLRGYSDSEAARRVMASRPSLFRTVDGVAVIAEQDFRSLKPGERRALRADDFRGLARAAVWFFLVLAGVLLFTFGQTYLQAYVGQMIMKDLRTEAFDHTVGLSLRYLDSQPVGRLVNRITNDVETVNELFTSVLPSLLRDFVMMGGVLVALTLLNPRLALVTLATLPPVLVLTLLFRSRAREVFRRVRQAVSRLNGFLAVVDRMTAAMDILCLFIIPISSVRTKYSDI